MITYFVVQFKSNLTGKWITEERYFINNYDNSQTALNLAIDEYNKEYLYEKFEKRIVKVTEEIYMSTG